MWPCSAAGRAGCGPAQGQAGAAAGERRGLLRCGVPQHTLGLKFKVPQPVSATDMHLVQCQNSHPACWSVCAALYTTHFPRLHTPCVMLCRRSRQCAAACRALGGPQTSWHSRHPHLLSWPL
jgi:hypothetical protein